MRYAIALNSKHPLGVQANAIGHIAVGLAHLVPPPQQKMRSFSELQSNFVGLMSDYPLIVLSARNSNQLRMAHEDAIARQLIYNVFVADMRSGEPGHQLMAVAQKPISDLEYIGLGCWGEAHILKSFTKKFSLLA